MKMVIDFDILKQPDATTCGPTCLHAVYRYYGEDLALGDLIPEIPELDQGGTLDVYLACHALRRGYQATIIPYNLQLFDPTWARASQAELAEKLRRQLACKKHLPGFAVATQAYLEYLALGGRLRFEVMTAALIRRYLKRAIPVLTGLSATYLYNCAREYDLDGRAIFDDVRGVSAGHFVVLSGYNLEDRSVRVADPFLPNPFSPTRYYDVNIYRLICAIMLGILTYDGNLLIIERPKHRGRRRQPAQASSGAGLSRFCPFSGVRE